MTVSSARQALIQHIIDTPDGPPIGLPNREAPELTSATPVRWVVQAGSASPRTFDVRGTVRATVEVMVRVEMTAGEYAGLAEASVAVLETRFKPSTKFSGLQVLEPPDPRAPVEENGLYAIPVMIRAVTVY